MSWMWLFSLVILAFLIFMVVVLLYINKAVKDEINSVQKQLLTQFSIEYAEELYDQEHQPVGEAVGNVMEVMERIEQDWGLDVDYDKFRRENKIRKTLKKRY